MRRLKNWLWVAKGMLLETELIGILVIDQLAMTSIWKLSEAVNLAFRAESQVTRANTRSSYGRKSRVESFPEKQKFYVGPTFCPSIPSNKIIPESSFGGNKNASKAPMVAPKPNHYTKPMTGKCYRCNLPGHRSNDCPQRRQVTMVEGASDEESEHEISEDDCLDGAELVHGDDGDRVASTSCTCYAIWLRNLLKEIGMVQGNATEINVDNKSAIALSKNLVFHDRSKHIDTRFHFIRDCISKKEIHVKYVKSEDQIAYIFTKPIKLRTLLGVCRKSCLSGDVGS
ncbi:hypothetical protein EZV62_023437 [Acer yangbiense]|uniref:CCHC-type domain-containing protein n=1 Tax=Acer yangbiense TaxID=1000413 RepID=A0A5C7H1S3_9ROSI|nr:hypothetical protein EZV62_023437 [Acer yangbiense]